MREDLGALVNRLDVVHKNPAYESVWIVSHLHVGPYAGPAYTEELERARQALADTTAGKRALDCVEALRSVAGDWTEAEESSWTCTEGATDCEVYDPRDDNEGVRCEHHEMMKQCRAALQAWDAGAAVDSTSGTVNHALEEALKASASDIRAPKAKP
jgi:hypothetical protein